jgi:NAD(P)-dependent dehydrogenase (short-subunit alcohol dehydrogenase family)
MSAGSGVPRPSAAGFDLTGKVAVVTGGSRGLGRAMVHAFAHAGADVMIVSRKLDACEAVAREVREETGRRAVAHACHVGTWGLLDGLVDAAWSAFGAVDIWVNNAGLAPTYESLAAVDERLFDTTFAINCKGPFRLCALVGERMAAGRGGSVINVSSTGSIRPTPEIVPYAAAKAGLNAMTEGFAAAYGPKVRFNVLMAGPFRTDATVHWPETAHEVIATRHALGRIGDPSEVVGAALYLASDASSYTTGATIRVDGGMP